MLCEWCTQMRCGEKNAPQLIFNVQLFLPSPLLLASFIINHLFNLNHRAEHFLKHPSTHSLGWSWESAGVSERKSWRIFIFHRTPPSAPNGTAALYHLIYRVQCSSKANSWWFRISNSTSSILVGGVARHREATRGWKLSFKFFTLRCCSFTRRALVVARRRCQKRCGNNYAGKL